jgi:hypothetical protein
MSLRILSTTTAVAAMTVGIALACAPAAVAAPPPGTMPPVPRSTLISQGFTCTATQCTKPGTSVVFLCSGAVCTLRV